LSREVGLLAPIAGKNGWTLAEVAGEATPDGMHRLLNAATWDVDGVRDDARDYAVEHLADGDGVLVVDETVEFATKPVLAQAMLARALDAGVPARWATADGACGGDSKFRA
jgi:SRSO17 transposase